MAFKRADFSLLPMLLQPAVKGQASLSALPGCNSKNKMQTNLPIEFQGHQ